MADVKTTTASSATRSGFKPKPIEIQVAKHGALIWVLLLGVVGAIVLLSVDLFQDRQLHDRILELSARVSESETIVIKQETALTLFKQCLDLGAWTRCFK